MLVITSKNNTPLLGRYTNSQLRYALVYVLITLVVLLFLNIYCSQTNQKLFYSSKEKALLEKCQLAASEVENLEVISSTTVSSAVAQMGSLKVTRLMVTNHNGLVIYDSYGRAAGTYALLAEIVRAMEGNDVACWYYHDGAMKTSAAVPLTSCGNTLGCIYMMEYDETQGALLKSMQMTVLKVTFFLEIAVILFSLAFSNTFSKRMKKIMASMRIIQSGDYTYKLKMGGHDELTFLADEFNDLTERLQTSEQKRRRFVSDASHELKTPLASIKLLTDSILQNDMDMDTVREFVGDIGNEAERLNRTSAKLLSLTRIDSRFEEESEIIDMAPTVNQVVRMLTSIAEQHHITLDLDIQSNCPVLITEDDLYQIAFNLVENGIKYNTPGGKLTVRVFRQDDNAVLQVQDSGVGIPEDALEHIFERFYRVDKARSRATGGSGLGLAIVRAIVQRCRGEITVNTVLGEGSTFTVTFPVFDTEGNL